MPVEKTQVAEWEQATRMIAAARRVLVVTHHNPDGDAIGSLLGLGHLLRAQGRDVTLAVDEGVPNYLSFLAGADTVQPGLSEGQWDVLVIVDCADSERAGEVGRYAQAHSAQLINVDHHPTNPMFGTARLVLPSACSTAEVIYLWAVQADWPIQADAAQAILTGLVTDTLGFRTSSVTPQTLHIAQILMEAGASLSAIMAHTLDSRSYDDVRAWKAIMPTVTLEGQVIWAEATLLAAEAHGLEKTEDADLVQWMNQVNEARIAAVFKEKEPQTIRVSLRCKRGYNVAEVARQFGGGGHVQAAGLTFQGTLAEAKVAIMPLLHEAAARGKLELG
ncbi:MAG: bifunctional oligoribonuclease/PAP phosphatase NrnA [Anaerolineae bacterium]|nr:bifunctional oligoribonuclease/PAP phosphatase NrnA [Anaerolineae bacterium]MDW8171488.1 bifunctional oligoribonuclease/PAP phosphatase NrnA [Anaerolineae bacterium]